MEEDLEEVYAASSSLNEFDKAMKLAVIASGLALGSSVLTLIVVLFLK